MLEVSALTKSFGGLRAVDEVSFDIGAGEIVGLIGPNGAGKTTLFNMISGVYGPDRGQVVFKGREITGRRPSEICHEGLVRTFQIVRTFDHSTVYENVVTGALFGSGGGVTMADARERTDDILEFTELDGVRDQEASELPIAKRKRVELARALACGPDLLMIDEMGAGLTPAEIDELVDTIRRVRSEFGPSVLWIEHVMRAILGSSDRVLVLHQGELIASGPPEEVEEDREVVRAYLGDTV